jgi:hypothetical protein
MKIREIYVSGSRLLPARRPSTESGRDHARSNPRYPFTEVIFADMMAQFQGSSPPKSDWVDLLNPVSGKARGKQSPSKEEDDDHEQVHHGTDRDVLSRSNHRVHSDCGCSGRDSAIGHRFGTHGNDFCGWAHLRRALQPGGDTGRLDPRAMRHERRCTLLFMVSQASALSSPRSS